MKEIWVDDVTAADVGYVFASVATYEFAGMEVTFSCWALDRMARIYCERGGQEPGEPPAIFRFIWNDALRSAAQALRSTAERDGGGVEAALSANLAALAALQVEDSSPSAPQG